MESWRRQRHAFAQIQSRSIGWTTPVVSRSFRPHAISAAHTRTLSSTWKSSPQRSTSVRRRERYGGVELVASSDPSGRLRNVGRFRLEPRPDALPYEEEMPSSPVLLENPQTEIRWYLRYFLGHEHRNLAGVDPGTKSPFFLSLISERDSDPASTKIRAILWLKTGPKKLYITMPDSGSRSGLAKAVLQKFPGMVEYTNRLKEITNPRIQKDLAMLEDQEGSINFKMGVIYRESWQKSDDEMLSNGAGNSDWDMFLRVLGQEVELKGWGSFKGGLDTLGVSTGTRSLYTRFAGMEIMFHVSTMLPYSHANPQQVERKRHIGNDIVNIIFESGGDPRHPTFSPSMMKSQFTHVFAVVTLEATTGLWRLWILSEESVPAYGPLLPNPNTFSHPTYLREFLLTKLINGERAAFGAAVFTEKRERTTDSIMKDMYMEYMKDHAHRGLGQKVTEGMTRHWLRSGKGSVKEQVEVEQFLKLGELIKLERLLSGEVPDYSDNTQATLYRKQPWEPELVVGDLPSMDVVCSDSWGRDVVVVGTKSAGVRVLGPTSPGTQLFDTSFFVSRLDVVESFGLLFALCDQGKDSWMTVFMLGELRSALNSSKVLSKTQALTSRIAATKGAKTYALSDSSQLRLTLAVAIGKKVVILRWALGPLGKTKPGSDLSNYLTPLSELSMEQDPVCLSLFETGPGGSLRAAVATESGLFLSTFATGISTLVHRHPPEKGAVKSVSASWENEDLELVLNYENTTLVFDPNSRGSSLEILWTSTPLHIAYRFPFILGFTGDTMEVRLGVNGNLLATSFIPALNLFASKGDVMLGAEQTMPGPGGSKRWGLYRISGDALSGEEDRHRGLEGAKTPQPLRYAPLQGKGSHQLGEVLRSSTGSDSGVGGGRNSSSSSEGRAPLGPGSPLANDPFDFPPSPLASRPHRHL